MLIYRVEKKEPRSIYVYVFIAFLVAFVTSRAMDEEWGWALSLLLIYPILRMTKSKGEWVEIHDDRLLFSPTFLNTKQPLLSSNDLQIVRRMMERTVIQGKYGPKVFDDWTIHFICKDGRTHRMADTYPVEFNLALHEFCAKNRIKTEGLEDAIAE